MGFGNRGGPPTWLVFILGVAFVMGLYYVWIGVSNFISTAGRGIMETTATAQVISTATSVQITLQAQSIEVTGLPSATPIPECQDFIVTVNRANVRASPGINASFVQTIDEGETVCVLLREGDWYLLDLNPATRRIETGYVREDLIEAINPTPTPSNTFTPAPTVTPVPTDTPTITPSPRPTNTPDPDASDTPTPTPTATPTSPFANA